MKLAVLINNLASCYNLQGCCLNNAWTTLLLCLSSIVRKMLKTLGGARGLGIRVWVRIRYRYRMTSAIDHRPGHSNPCIVRTSGRVEKWAGEKAGEMPLLSGFSSRPLFLPPAFPPARFSSRPQKVPPIRFPGAQLFHSSRNKPVSKQ